MRADSGVIRPAYRWILSLYGLIWLMNAAFWLAPWILTSHAAAAQNFIGLFARSTKHAPQLLKPLFAGLAAGVEFLGPLHVAIAMAIAAAAIGLALAFRFLLVSVAIFGFLYSWLLWVAIEGMGFPYTNGQTDPSVMPVYAISFMFVLAIGVQTKNTKRHISEPLWMAARIVFGLLWLFDAVLKWLPAFLFHFDSQITGQFSGQPSWIVAWLHVVLAIITFVGPVTFAVMIALIETVIAVSLLTGRALQYIMPLAILYALGVWCTAETFGGPYSVFGTGVRGDVVGNVLVYIIPLLMVFARVYSAQGQGATMAAENPAHT